MECDKKMTKFENDLVLYYLVFFSMYMGYGTASARQAADARQAAKPKKPPTLFQTLELLFLLAT